MFSLLARLPLRWAERREPKDGSICECVIKREKANTSDMSDTLGAVVFAHLGCLNGKPTEIAADATERERESLSDEASSGEPSRGISPILIPYLIRLCEYRARL